jgi:hypothetical protein
MSYITPSDVHAPKRFWSLIHVIFDGGAGGSSLAIGRWENKPVLAMRWNGTEDNPIGNPQSRGLPTWVIVPDQHWKQILETQQYKTFQNSDVLTVGRRKTINEDTLNLARNFLELRRVYFVNRCPNPECRDYEKLVLHEYRTEQIGKLLDQLKQDELLFYHIICDHFWNPSPQDKADLMHVLTTARNGSGVTLTARLLDDGSVITCLTGLSVAHPPPSEPQHFDMLMMQLNNSPLTEDKKEAFIKALRKDGTADIFLPRHTSQLFAV